MRIETKLAGGQSESLAAVCTMVTKALVAPHTWPPALQNRSREENGPSSLSLLPAPATGTLPGVPFCMERTPKVS